MSKTTVSHSENKNGVSEKKSRKQRNSSLEALLETGLREIYSAELQLLEALPRVAKACYSEDLQDAIEHALPAVVVLNADRRGAVAHPEPAATDPAARL